MYFYFPSKKLKITNSATKKSLNYWKLTEDEDEIDFFNQMGVSVLDSDDSSSLDLILGTTMSANKTQTSNDCDLESQNHEYFYKNNNNNDDDDEDNNDNEDDVYDYVSENSKHINDKFPISITNQTVICNVNERKPNKPTTILTAATTTVPVATSLANSVISGCSTNTNTSLEIYSDTPEDKITIKNNSTVMCKMTARGCHQSNQYFKDRTPLTTVTDNKLKTKNNNNNKQNTINDKVTEEVLMMSDNKHNYDMQKIVDENFYLYRKKLPKIQSDEGIVYL